MVAVAGVEDFANRLGTLAMPHEVLRHRHRIGHGGAEVAVQPVDADGRATRAEQERVPRRRADGCSGIELRKPHPLLRHSIELRRGDLLLPIASEIAETEIVGEDK